MAFNQKTPDKRVVLEYFKTGNPYSSAREDVWCATTPYKSWTVYGHGSTPKKAWKYLKRNLKNTKFKEAHGSPEDQG